MKNRKNLMDQVRSKKGKKQAKSKEMGKEKRYKKEVHTIKLKKSKIKTFRKEDKYNLLLWKDSNYLTTLTMLYGNSTQTVKCVRKK